MKKILIFRVKKLKNYEKKINFSSKKNSTIMKKNIFSSKKLNNYEKKIIFLSKKT